MDSPRSMPQAESQHAPRSTICEHLLCAISHYPKLVSVYKPSPPGQCPPDLERGSEGSCHNAGQCHALEQPRVWTSHQLSCSWLMLGVFALVRWRRAATCWRCTQTSRRHLAPRTTTILRLWARRRRSQPSGTSCPRAALPARICPFLPGSCRLVVDMLFLCLRPCQSGLGLCLQAEPWGPLPPNPQLGRYMRF